MKKNKHCLCYISKEECIANLLTSIAKEETSISHILNAESEKLEAIIQRSEISEDDLLSTNQSVKEMIDAIIQLELVLQKKLELFEKSICESI